MTEHAASCKFCELPVTLRIHPDALDMFDMKTWVALAACNRCGDYHTRRNSLTTAVQSVATKWLQASTLQDNEREEAMSGCRGALEKLTRKLAELAAKHYRCGFTWEADWVQQIIDTPQNATLTCTFYERQLRLSPDPAGSMNVNAPSYRSEMG